jgi:dihydroneopterin aldolase
MKNDTIRLRNMRFYAYHGLFPEEARLGQRFEVDVDLIGDFARAGRDDDLEQSINYADVYKIVEDVVTQRRFKLVEALAEHLAEAIGSSHAPISLVVRVRKPHPPVPGDFDGIEVEIQRRYD